MTYAFLVVPYLALLEESIFKRLKMFTKRKMDDMAWISQNNEEKYNISIVIFQILWWGQKINIGNNLKNNINQNNSHNEFKNVL